MINEPILKKKNKKRNLMKSQIFMILLTVIFLLGVTYAFFEFSRASKQEIMNVAGNIYMNLLNENIDTTNKMYPMESSRGLLEGTKYNFTVNGYNDSKDTIYYGIYVSKGEDIENKIRLKDSDIMMVLYETVNGEKRKVYGPGSVEEMDETLIYANSILGNMSETDNVSIDYELIFWVSEKVLISNTMNIEGRSIYTQEDFANSYFNLRVIVGGDFEEKNTINDEVTINAKTKSDNVTYITNLSYEETPIVNDDVIINFTMNKEPNKLVITNELTNDRDEFVPVKNGEVWTYQKEESDNGKYTYYIEYSDGMRSEIYHYNVRIDKEDPVFNLEAGTRLKVKNSTEEIEITNKITNISEDVVTLKYAMIKKGEVVDRYQNITNFGTTYEIDEELTNGVYELHVLAIDESGKQHTDYVTYEVAYDIPVIYQINDIVGKVEVVKGESINYLSNLPNKGVGVTKFTQNNEDMQEVTNETVVTDDLKSIYVNYTDTVSKLIHEHNGNNGLVAISTKGSKLIANDTFREYRYSGNGRYCTYTNDGTTYTLNVESYESTCPNACINTHEDGWKYIIHRTSDLFTATTTNCDIEVLPNDEINTFVDAIIKEINKEDNIMEREFENTIFKDFFDFGFKSRIYKLALDIYNKKIMKPSFINNNVIKFKTKISCKECNAYLDEINEFPTTYNKNEYLGYFNSYTMNFKCEYIQNQTVCPFRVLCFIQNLLQ